MGLYMSSGNLDGQIYVTRTWIRDQSSNFMTLKAAVALLAERAVLPGVRWYDRRDVARTTLLKGERLFTPLASFKIDEAMLRVDGNTPGSLVALLRNV
jgi:hypothetical protein